jgi:hypothetical protein
LSARYKDGYKEETYKNITQELILDSNSDAHTSEDKDISPPQIKRVKGEDKTETHYTGWTNSTQYQPSAPRILMFTGGPRGFRGNEAPHISRLFPTEHFHVLSFLEIIRLLMEKRN